MLEQNQTNVEIREEVVHQKVQLSRKINLRKPISENVDANGLTIEVSFEKETVQLGGKLTEESYFTMFSLFSFTFHVSGWFLKRIIGINVKLVSYLLIRCLSYLEIPSDLQSGKYLLNIK